MDERQNEANANWNAEVALGESISVEEFERMCAEAFILRDKILTAENLLNEQKKELKSMQECILFHMNQFKKDSYKSNWGTLSIAKKLSVKTPKTPEEKAAFFEYLKSKGLYDDMITVNSITLNAFYRDEWDQALEQGATSFSMPGIGEPTYYEQLQMRKG